MDKIRLRQRISGRKYLLFFILTVAITIATVISISVGKYYISPGEIGRILSGKGYQDSLSYKVFINLRLPRTIMALSAGLAFGVCGMIFQMLFHNPLASPDIIGVASGANLGAALAILIGSSSSYLGITLGSFIGGIIAVLLVILLVRSIGMESTAAYVLAGIILNSLSRAGIMALKYFADPENELAAMEYWEMGTFGNITGAKVRWVLPVVILCVLFIFLLGRQIQLLTLGDREARTLGVDVESLRIILLIISTLMVTSIVSMTGLVAFVGLIAPHIARLILKYDDTSSIFLSGAVGSLIVIISDILSRLLYSTELPISILTSAIGVPLIIYFLKRNTGYKGKGGGLI